MYEMMQPLPLHSYRDLVSCVFSVSMGLIDRSSFRNFDPNWVGTALDVLKDDFLDSREKINIVSSVGWLPERLLQELVLWCGEEALNYIETPKPIHFEVLKTKRRWMLGEASDEDLYGSKFRAEINAFSPAEYAVASVCEVNLERAVFNAINNLAGAASWKATEERFGSDVKENTEQWVGKRKIDEAVKFLIRIIENPNKSR
jgi:hypothetical protein